jgi:type II secretory pathway pseudopilin PulG
MNRPRVGMSLIEVMLAMVIGTAVVTVLGIAVSRMLLSNGVAHQHLQTVATIGRLGEEFRRDAHAASRVALEGPEDASRLKLTGTTNQEIVYQLVPGGVERLASQDDQLRRRELFLLPGMRLLGWKLDEDRREVALAIGRLARPSADDKTLRGQFSILAVLRNTPAAP